jgi:hypothetical protein
MVHRQGVKEPLRDRGAVHRVCIWVLRWRRGRPAAGLGPVGVSRMALRLCLCLGKASIARPQLRRALQ